MSEEPSKIVRSAIYARKSSDEGLEQPYNSLDAQRDACAAYIASQRHEGWQLIPKFYDDGGFSGGSMKRPALQELLGDIRAGQVDVVVVYKIDRLTRALLDFAKIIEILDESKASFVSVTQAFNTTSSMGRLTLNVLLSFAQFERELTSERTREKAASTRARGYWVGGQVPFGYDFIAGELVPNEAEAAAVQSFFAHYLKRGSIPAVQNFAAANGIVGKVRGQRPAKALNYGNFAAILTNPVYIGKIRHRDQVLPGKHQVIVEAGVFEKVQQRIAAHRRGLAVSRNAPPTYLLDGILRSPDGGRYAGRHDNEYSTQSYHGPKGSGLPLGKVNTASLDRAVLNGVCDFLDACRLTGSREAAAQLGQLTAHLRSGKAHQRKAHLLNVLEYAVLNGTTMTVTLRMRAAGFAGALAQDSDVVVPLVRRRTKSGCVVVAGGRARTPNLPLVRLLSKGAFWLEEIISGRVASVAALARREGFHATYVSNTIETAFLAPDLKRRILEGDQPLGLTAESLRTLCPLPVSWAQQRIMIERIAVAGPLLTRQALLPLKAACREESAKGANSSLDRSHDQAASS